MRYMTTISNSAIVLKIRVSKRSKYDMVSEKGDTVDLAEIDVMQEKVQQHGAQNVIIMK